MPGDVDVKVPAVDDQAAAAVDVKGEVEGSRVRQRLHQQMWRQLGSHLELAAHLCLGLLHLIL